MKTKKDLDLMELVLSQIPKEESDAKTSRYLMAATGLSFRELKAIITYLREDYPICAKETGGGGYWMAEDDIDIEKFILMISRRRDGYNQTINMMENHLGGV